MRPRQFQAQLTRYFAGRRRQAYDELIAALDGDRYLALLTAIDALLTDPPFTAEADKPARRRLIPVLRRVYRHVDQNLTTAAHLPHGDDRNTALHEARKAAKRLRYATEAAAPALGKPARRLTDRVKQLQELLRHTRTPPSASTSCASWAPTPTWKAATASPSACSTTRRSRPTPTPRLAPATKNQRTAIKGLA
jgi:hypothetical protein